jgi:hypothetical protein
MPFNLSIPETRIVLDLMHDAAIGRAYVSHIRGARPDAFDLAILRGISCKLDPILEFCVAALVYAGRLKFRLYCELMSKDRVLH